MEDVEFLKLVSNSFRDVTEKCDALILDIEKGEDEDKIESSLKEMVYSLFKANSVCDSALSSMKQG